MDIVKQIVDQRVNKIIEDNPSLFADTKNYEQKRSRAFLLLGVAAYLEIDIAEAVQYLTDGGNDGGFDAAYITEAQDSQLHVILFQSKYVRDLEKDSSFPANAVEKAVNTIRCVFDPKARMLLNEESKKKVGEIQSFILDGYIPYVKFVMLSNGSKWNQDAQNHIDNEFAGQKQVEFEHFNHYEISRYINKSKEINTTLPLTGTAINEDFNYKRVILGRISIMEIHRIMEEYGDALLERNIRRYLGKNAVNDGIRASLLEEEGRQNFFFFNNGVTMICERFSINGLQKEDWKVKVNQLQIINGGQTCKTIHQTISENPSIDFSQVYVLVRLYEVSGDEKVVQDITYATNSQNPVDLRDLKSTDEVQRLLERSAKELGYTYKPKRDNQSSTDVIPSSVAAEAVLAIWRESPHLAKYKKNELFDKYYRRIFDYLNAAQMVMAVLILRYCDAQRKMAVPAYTDEAAQQPYSHYFLACMMGKMLLERMDLDLNGLTHNTFSKAKDYFETHSQELYEKAQTKLIEILHGYFSQQVDSLWDIDGRTMAAAFRRFDIIERYIKNDRWWNAHMK